MEKSLILTPNQAKQEKVEILAKQRGAYASQFISWRDRKRKKTASMVPDRGFVKQLKTLDDELMPVWDDYSEKWEIWRFPKDGKEPFHMLTVQTKDRTYRELGSDILLKLQESDPHRFTRRELINYFEEMDRQIERRKEQDLINTIESITRENLDRMRGVIKIQVPGNVVRAING